MNHCLILFRLDALRSVQLASDPLRGRAATAVCNSQGGRPMTKTVLSVTVLVALTVFTARSGIAQSNFYEGKTIRIIVGFSPGGVYDALARMLSRHIPKYIPGHPTILVENMTGAGSLLAANHIFRVAKPDGLTFGHFSGGFAYSQLMGQPGVEFDTQKFVFVGA